MTVVAAETIHVSCLGKLWIALGSAPTSLHRPHDDNNNDDDNDNNHDRHHYDNDRDLTRVI